MTAISLRYQKIKIIVEKKIIHPYIHQKEIYPYIHKNYTKGYIISVGNLEAYYIRSTGMFSNNAILSFQRFAIQQSAMQKLRFKNDMLK